MIVSETGISKPARVPNVLVAKAPWVITAPFGLPVVPFQLGSIKEHEGVASWTHGCVTDCSNTVRCDSGGWKWVLGTDFLDFRCWVLSASLFLFAESTLTYVRSTRIL